MLCRAGRQMAKNSNKLPSNPRAIRGYRYHPTKPTVGNVMASNNSITGMKAPSARIAPPKTYSFPRFTYFLRTITAVTNRAMKPVTGRAKLRNQAPFVAKLIYRRYSPAAAKSQGTKITGFGLENHSGNMITTCFRALPKRTLHDRLDGKAIEGSQPRLAHCGNQYKHQPYPLSLEL